ncbi:MAG: hypothetical protein SF053_00680 [Bacteroidia bacterium]|nr:hypothetical protein [Bacteroidia bacterium]
MYYKPDERWEIFRITDRELFEEKFVLKGHFHTGVPQDVREAFVTVEYLLASAWHYWPLYDEGVNKALRLIEIAVKLKAKEIGIGLTYKDKQGKSRSVALAQLIDQICPDPHHAHIKERLHRFRRIRNSQMHPDNHSYMGAMDIWVKNLKSVVNVLNLMFLPDAELVEMHRRTEVFTSSLTMFKDQLLVLEVPEKKYLIHSIQSFVVARDTFFIALEPVMLDAFEAISNHRDLSGLLMVVRNPIPGEGSISGQDSAGNAISLSLNHKEENRETHRFFCEDLAKLDNTSRSFYQLHLKNHYIWQIEEEMYAWWGV